jgi:hypothetical protein
MACRDLHTVLRVILLACLGAVALGGCERALAPADSRGLQPLAIAKDAQRFRIVPGESRLVLLVYREGRMARLGHNHVISTNQLQGEVYVAARAQDSAAELRFAVADLQVDEPDLRTEFGDDFPGSLDDSAIAGTRSNMLSPKQLDAEVWPDIVLRTASISGAWPALTMDIQIALQGRVHRVQIPATVNVTGDGKLMATADFPLLQTELGLEPFSVMLGALRVRDQIDARLRISAIAD